MPIRGENVGTAYVRILADGDGLAKSIRDELDDTDDLFDEKGKTDAENYSKGVNRELRKQRPGTQKRVEELFTLHGQRAKAITREMSSTFFKNLEANIKNTYGESIGDRIIRDVRKGFLKGGGYKAFGEDMQDLFARLPDYAEKAAREVERIEKTTNAERAKDFRKTAAEIVDSFESIRRGERATGLSMRKSITATTERAKELRIELNKRTDLGDKDRDLYRKMLDDIEHGLARVLPRFRRFNGALDATTPRIGRAFGKESRNDFVHFIGSAVEGVSRLAFTIPKIGEKVFGVAKTFIDLRKSGSSVLQSLKGSFTGAGEGAGAFASSLSAAAIAIPVVVAVVGVLVSALSLLLGTIVALASTISFALVGGLAVLATTLGPIAAGIAVVTAGILSMSDAQKKALKTAIKPFTDEMRALGQIASKELFKDAESQARRLGSVFDGLRPLVRGVAREIRLTGNAWLDALETPEFNRFKVTLNRFIPEMVGHIGKIIGNIAAGIGGMFASALPMTNQFLKSLEGITAEFANWANKKEGREAVQDFLVSARDSAKALGHFIGQVGGLLGDLLFNAEGKKTGDSLFDSMADAIKRFRDYIADGKLEQWFKDSKKFAEELGDAIKGIGQLLDTLDSPGFRSFAIFVIGSLKRMAEWFEAIVGPIADFAHGLDQLLHGDFSGAWDTLVDSLSKLPGRILTIMTVGFGESFVNYFKEVGGNIVQGLWDGINELWDGFIDWIQGLPRMLIGAFTGPLGIHSPSTVFAQFGRDIIMGLLQGLAEFLRAPIDLLIGLAVNMGSAFAGALGPAFQAVGSFAAGVAGDLRDKLGTGLDFARDKAKGLGSFLSGGFKLQIGLGKDAAKGLASLLRGDFSGAAAAARSAASRLGGYLSGGLSGALRGAKSAASGVRDAFQWVGDKIGWLIGKVQDLIGWLGKIHLPSLDPGGGVPFVPGVKTGGVLDMFGLHKVKKMAFGGLANFAQKYQIGEAGREAIVPLDRPLGQVDPAVRMLSAFAQGKLGNVSNDRSRTVDASGWIIQTDTADPAAVAQEALDALIAKFT